MGTFLISSLHKLSKLHTKSTVEVFINSCVNNLCEYSSHSMCLLDKSVSFWNFPQTGGRPLIPRWYFTGNVGHVV